MRGFPWSAGRSDRKAEPRAETRSEAEEEGACGGPDPARRGSRSPLPRLPGSADVAASSAPGRALPRPALPPLTVSARSVRLPEAAAAHPGRGALSSDG